MSGTGIIQALLRDTKANMMAIGAASIIPLVGIVGGGVDASRMYLAQSRLQQACDSATLAARKKLSGSSVTDGNIPSDIVDTADNFFDTNFPSGMYGTTNANYTLSAGTATRMDGTASAAVPTTLMKVFNIPTVSISATCSAELNLPNIDVMLVLDNSGSMRNDRIATLKTAVFSFYDDLMASKPSGTRVRIGMVPYSNTVNVGELLLDTTNGGNTDWMRSSAVYQSREALFDTIMTDPGSPFIPGTPGTPGSPEREELVSDQRTIVPRNDDQLGTSSTNKYRYKNNASAKKQGWDDCQDMAGTYMVGSQKWIISDMAYIKGYFSNGNNKKRAACEARVRIYDIIPAVDPTPGTPDTPAVPPTYEDVFREYHYKPISYNTSQFLLGNVVSTPTGIEGADVASRVWNGCIEEVQTVASATYDPIPTGALDLDIDIVPDPTKPETQWAPHWPDVTFDRDAPAEVLTTDADFENNYEYDCPVRSYKLQEWPMSGAARNAAFTTAVNSMVASGYTMHDIGMLWAGRLLSPDGLFASDNAVAPNGDPISRHIVFMTDGKMEPGPDSYHAYGDYDVEGRINGFAADGTWSTTDIGVFHSKRLEAICKLIKNKNITIWSVAFELDHTDYTRECATGGSARAFKADNNAQLIAKFKEIATSIAELRLTQ